MIIAPEWKFVVSLAIMYLSGVAVGIFVSWVWRKANDKKEM